MFNEASLNILVHDVINLLYYNWAGIKYPSKIDDWKTFEKNNPTVGLNVFILKKWKHVQLIFQNITQPVKKNYSFNDP